MTITSQIRSGINPKTIAKWQGQQDGGGLIIEVYSEIISENDLEYEISEMKKIRTIKKLS